MGNNTSNQLKTKYERGQYKVLEAKEDSNIGHCEVISFQGCKDVFMQKDLDPSEYNDDIESNTFQNKLNRQCKYICDFYFVTYDNTSPNYYKMIYEYGKPFKKNLTKEKYIWYFIRQIVKAGIYLEDNCLHYPYLAKKYIVQKEPKHFKLVNPFCFPDFLKEVIKIYMCPREQISTRNKYSQECIQKNTFQLPFLIISVITGVSEYDLKNELNLLQNQLIQIEKRNYTKNLVEFLYFLLQDRPKKFFNIEKFMEGLGIDFKNPKTTRTFPHRNQILDYSVLQSPGSSRMLDTKPFENRISQSSGDQERVSIPMSYQVPRQPRKPKIAQINNIYDSATHTGKFGRELLGIFYLV